MRSSMVLLSTLFLLDCGLASARLQAWEQFRPFREGDQHSEDKGDNRKFNPGFQSGENGFKKISQSEVPANFLEGSLEDLKLAAKRQLSQCEKGRQTDQWDVAGEKIPLSQWCTKSQKRMIEVLEQSKNLSEVMKTLLTEFNWYQSKGKDGAGQMQFTGYYLPHMDASLSKTEEFQYPIYSRPNDLVSFSVEGRQSWRRKLPDGSLVPYYDRAEIDRDGALSGRGLEIAWVKDEVKAFFTQVQGSGVLNVFNKDTGKSERRLLNYAASNGQPYVSIGALLRSEGKDPKYFGSSFGIFDYFRDFPEDLHRVLWSNPSYIFFGLGETGPYGSANTVIVPGHSIAVDSHYFPLGMIGLIQTQRPVHNPGKAPVAWKSMTRLVIPQDTGGAIRSPGRVDIFWGDDDYAEYAAGYSNQGGSLYFAVLK